MPTNPATPPIVRSAVIFSKARHTVRKASELVTYMMSNAIPFNVTSTNFDSLRKSGYPLTDFFSLHCGDQTQEEQLYVYNVKNGEANRIYYSDGKYFLDYACTQSITALGLTDAIVDGTILQNQLNWVLRGIVAYEKI